jgi:hypothetical protein
MKEDATRKLKVAVIREEYVSITGNYLCALLLNQLIYWTMRIKDYDDMLKEEEVNQDKDFSDAKKHGWIYKKASDFREELMVDVSDVTIRTYLINLIKSGFLEQRSNPKYKWDKTLQYRVNLRAVNNALKNNGYSGVPGVCTTKGSNVSVLNDLGAIPETISETKINNKIFPKGNINVPSEHVPQKPLKPSPIIKRRSIKKVPIRVPVKIAAILDYWESKGLQLARVNTKSYRDSVRSIATLFKGTAFNDTEYDAANKQFTTPEIKMVIDRFALAATDTSYLPLGGFKRHLRKLYPQTFIYNRFGLNGGAEKSQFIHYLKNDPKPTLAARKDKHPKLTKAIKEEYRKTILGGYEVKFTIEDENKFISAAERATEFFRIIKPKLASYLSLDEEKIAGWMVRSIKDVLGDVKLNQVTPGWLCSNNMFNHRLPAYLYAQAMIVGPKPDYHPLSEPFEGDSSGSYAPTYYQSPDEETLRRFNERFKEDPPSPYEVDDVSEYATN